MTSTDAAAAAWLLSPEAVRTQCRSVFEAACGGGLSHFAYRPEAMDNAIGLVVDTIGQNYPSGNIPFHARWRHFVIDGRDRWQTLASALDCEPLERARIRVDLAVTSVLLDAGAGPQWRYRDTETGRDFKRSEGLAIASLDIFQAGAFADDPTQPLRADAAALSQLDEAALAENFQVDEENPLEGLSGRVALLNRLGGTLAAAPAFFGESRPRVGNLAEVFLARSADGKLKLSSVLLTLLEALGPIWPGRITLAGRNLGDTWQHPAAGGEDAASGLVPFHKLSQWLAYSLVEPLEELGLEIVDADDLTGLAEYRNGGLMVDSGLLVPKHDAVCREMHAASSEIIVEWRALTVALLDRIAVGVRDVLGVDAAAMPLAAVLEGGTWAAGRRIAAKMRPGGAPPINIRSDGSVF